MMTSPNASISVLIRTYTETRWNDFVAAVESVHQQTLPPLEIVVVVDHNKPLFERVKAQFPDVVLTENQYPAGSSGAWNSGVAAARGDIIAFFDDDALAAPDWLAQLLACYTTQDVVGVGGAIQPIWQNGRPSWFPEEFDWVVGCTYRGMPVSVAPVRNLIGCNMSLRRAIFEEIGGFREGIGHIGGRPVGGDETELCIRVGQRWPNKVLLHQPQAKVYHQVPRMRASWRYYLSRCRLEGQSKALVSQFVGARDGLSAESAYTFNILPQGVVRGLIEVITRRNLRGIGRSAAIVFGLGITTFSYLCGRGIQLIANSRRVARDGTVSQQGRIV